MNLTLLSLYIKILLWIHANSGLVPDRIESELPFLQRDLQLGLLVSGSSSTASRQWGARQSNVAEKVGSSLRASLDQINGVKGIPTRKKAEIEKIVNPLSSSPTERVFKVTHQDLIRLKLHLRLAAGLEKERRYLSGNLLAVAGIVESITGAVILVDRSNNERLWGLLPLSIGGLLLGWSAYTVLVPSGSEDLYYDLQTENYSSDSSRTKVSLEIEKKWREQVESRRSFRLISAYLNLALGGVVTASAITYAAMVSDLYGEESDRNVGYIMSFGVGALGLFDIGLGIFRLYSLSPLEQSFRLYMDQRSFSSSETRKSSSLNAVPMVISNGGGFAIFGGF